MNWAEFIGYIASALVAVSLLMVSLVRLRLLNLIGCAVFVVYGLVINALPIVITNGFIAVINLVFLYRIFFRNTDPFSYIHVSGENREVLEHFVVQHGNDVEKHFPLFGIEHLRRYLGSGGEAYLAFRDLSLVGFAVLVPVDQVTDFGSDVEKDLLARGCGNMDLRTCRYLPVDYIAKPYRDMGVAKKLYAEIARRVGNDASFIVTLTRQDQRRHMRFLKINGFSPIISRDQYALYARRINTLG